MGPMRRFRSVLSEWACLLTKAHTDGRLHTAAQPRAGRLA